MRIIITIFLFALLGCKSSLPVERSFYKGLERMCWTNDEGKIECYAEPEKWYHENSLFIENDSFFIYKVPVQIVGEKKYYSASDGAFYFYYGKTQPTDTGTIVNLTMNNCDYCGTKIRIDTATGFIFPVATTKRYKVTTIANGIRIGDVSYYKDTTTETYFPDKQLFYYDSNKIYRDDPKEQYQLITTGIKNFLQTREVKPEKDTLRICIDRIDHNDTIVETLKPERLKIDTSGIIFKYYTRQEIKNLTIALNRPIRYIEVGEIFDYWKSSIVSLKYAISLPRIIHGFSDREYSNSFEYHKVGTEYLLTGEVQENSWELIRRE